MVKTVAHDVIILGGGPAGVSCALELHENKIDSLLIDRNPRIGGQLPDIENPIRNFAARFWEHGADVQDDLEHLCQHVGLPVALNESISSVDLAAKRLCGRDAYYEAKAIFLATGTKRRKVPFARAHQFAAHIVFTVEDHEDLLRSKPVVIIGGGDNALMNSAWLAERCPKVFLVHRSDRFRARPDVIADAIKQPNVSVIPYSTIVSVDGTNGELQSVFVRNIRTRELQTLKAGNLVICLGYAPNSGLFQDQLRLCPKGYLVVDKYCFTGVDGIYAGGDLTSPDCQGIARSVGDGMVAARSIIQYLHQT